MVDSRRRRVRARARPGGFPVDIEIAHRTEGVWDILDVIGEVDLSTAPALRSRLDQVLSGGSRRLVVNLGGVAFMDSSGLSVLVAGMKGAREAGGEMAIACSSEAILKIFAITGLDRLISIHPTVTEAVAS